MSLYHETAAIVTSPSNHGGSLKSRIYGNKDLKSPPAQVYALAFESSKWSAILKEVVENSQLLQQERKVSPALAWTGTDANMHSSRPPSPSCWSTISCSPRRALPFPLHMGYAWP
jgi:hypothetical protein